MTLPGPRVRLSKLTVSVHLSHFLAQKPLGDRGEGLRFPDATCAGMLLRVMERKRRLAALVFRKP